MESMYIEATKSSPEVEYNPENNNLIISGESYPENSFAFYEPIFDVVEEAVEQDQDFKLIVHINYLNTSSTKSFMTLLDIIEEAYQNDQEVAVEWYYEENNEHSYELAFEFKEYMELPFKIISEAEANND